jgi:hypothetical protein
MFVKLNGMYVVRETINPATAEDMWINTGDVVRARSETETRTVLQLRNGDEIKVDKSLDEMGAVLNGKTA